MKKMSLNSSAIKGEILTRNELKKVMGGNGSDCVSLCKITYRLNGADEYHLEQVAPSSWAWDYCRNIMSSYASYCSYDCECDPLDAGEPR